MHSDTGAFDRNTFINCPFDAEYRPLLRALLFTVLDCGLEPRIALEKPDSGQVRVAKILSLIEASRFSIHDISRLEPLSAGDLPRLNMAFELGLDLGCRTFGPAELSRKQCLILEREPYRYQRVLSDLSGNDIRAHSGDPHQLIREVRNWVKVATGRRIHAAALISQRFAEFQSDLMSVLTRLGFSPDEIQSLEVVEFIEYAQEWIQDRPT
jgi:hypothetical protein